MNVNTADNIIGLVCCSESFYCGLSLEGIREHIGNTTAIGKRKLNTDLESTSSNTRLRATEQAPSDVLDNTVSKTRKAAQSCIAGKRNISENVARLKKESYDALPQTVRDVLKKHLKEATTGQLSFFVPALEIERIRTSGTPDELNALLWLLLIKEGDARHVEPWLDLLVKTQLKQVAPEEFGMCKANIMEATYACGPELRIPFTTENRLYAFYTEDLEEKRTYIDIFAARITKKQNAHVRNSHKRLLESESNPPREDLRVLFAKSVYEPSSRTPVAHLSKDGADECSDAEGT